MTTKYCIQSIKEYQFQQKLFPCHRCLYQGFCKWRGVVKSFDYPHEVFEVQIICKYFQAIEEVEEEKEEDRLCW